jgi:hypothetical protein
MKTFRNLFTAVTIVVAALTIASPASAQSFKEKQAAKREAKIAESEKPANIAEGASIFSVNLATSAAFDAALRHFQLKGVTIDEASRKDLGQLMTEIEVVDVGGYRNNNRGYRTMLTFIRDTDTSSTVRIVVTEQKRTKHHVTEPWTKPELNAERTAEAAEQLKQLLIATATSKQ